MCDDKCGRARASWEWAGGDTLPSTIEVGWKTTRSAECGVRSVENVEYGKCRVWKTRSMENAECGKCGVCGNAFSTLPIFHTPHSALRTPHSSFSIQPYLERILA